MKLKTLSWLAIATCGLACASHAVQIAYEGFNYADQTPLGGQGGGSGWMGTWLGPVYGGADFTNKAAGLNFTNDTGGYLAGIGGAIFDNDGSNSRQDYRQWFDPTTDITAAYGTNIWFSYLATYDTASGSGGGFNVFESAGDGTAGFGVVATGPAGGGNFVVQLRVGALGQGPAALPAFGLLSGPVNNLQSCQASVNLVVGRLQLEAGATGPSGAFTPYTGNDRLDVWLNPSAEPTGNSLLWYSGFYAYRNFPYSSGYLGIRTGGGCQMTIDEVRIGTTYSDVVPATAQTANEPPTPPQLSMNPAGAVGLQLNTSEATPTNFNEIATYATTNSGGGSTLIDCAWVGKTPASYSFTIAEPPAHGPNNFMAYVWLIPAPNGHIQALDNANAVQLALVSDGVGGAKAVLGYYVNGSSSVQANLQTLTSGPVSAGVGGVICTIPSAPFAGTWTIRLTSDTGFTIIAPNGAQASGSMATGDEGSFANGVTFYLGVSPNGGPNTGNPALGYHMTVSGVTITNNSGATINPAWNPGVIVQSDFTTGAKLTALNPPNWQVAANFPSCIYVMPTNSVYRAEWRNSCGPTPNSLTEASALTSPGNWSTVVPITALLSDSTNVAFVTTQYVTNAAGFFRVSIPYNP